MKYTEFIPDRFLAAVATVLSTIIIDSNETASSTVQMVKTKQLCSFQHVAFTNATRTTIVFSF